MIINVKCEFTIPIEIPDDPEYDMHFDIEDNHCPGTGRVWEALKKHISQCEEAQRCWACALDGTCKIVP